MCLSCSGGGGGFDSGYMSGMGGSGGAGGGMNVGGGGGYGKSDNGTDKVSCYYIRHGWY